MWFYVYLLRDRCRSNMTEAIFMWNLLDIEDGDSEDFCVDCGCTVCNIDFDLFFDHKSCRKLKRIKR